MILVSRDDAGAPSLADLQNKCEFQANLEFREWLEYRKAEAHFWDEDLERLTADYHSYYNTTLRHCLMLVEESASSKQGLSRVSFIFDTDEQRDSAFYLADENKVTVCELKPTADHETFCKTVMNSTVSLRHIWGNNPLTHFIGGETVLGLFFSRYLPRTFPPHQSVWRAFLY